MTDRLRLSLGSSGDPTTMNRDQIGAEIAGAGPHEPAQSRGVVGCVDDMCAQLYESNQPSKYHNKIF